MGHHRPYCPVKTYQLTGAVCQKMPFTEQRVDLSGIYKRLKALEAEVKALKEQSDG